MSGEGAGIRASRTAPEAIRPAADSPKKAPTQIPEEPFIFIDRHILIRTQPEHTHGQGCFANAFNILAATEKIGADFRWGFENYISGKIP
jgi:hypothetical protein